MNIYIIVAVFLAIIVIYKIAINTYNELRIAKTPGYGVNAPGAIKEEFVSTTGDKVSGAELWPVNTSADGGGFKTLVLTNTDSWPILSLGTLSQGSVSNLVGQYMRKLIYPVKLQICKSGLEILSELGSGNLDLGWVREPALLSMNKNAPADLSLISIISPAYFETIYFIGGNHSIISSITDLGRKFSKPPQIGILTDAKPYWDAIIKAHMINTIGGYIENLDDDLSKLLVLLESKQLDGVFMLVHPNDTRFQAYMKTNNTKFLSIMPATKYPIAKSIQSPYNPDTTDLIAKFRDDMRIFIPWIFDETVELGKPVSRKELANASSVYYTYKIRSYLCVSRELGRNTTLLNKIIPRWLTNYQSMNLLLNEWGGSPQERQSYIYKSNARSLEKQALGAKTIGDAKKVAELLKKSKETKAQIVLPTIVYSDYDSFNLEAIGAVPSELELNNIAAQQINDELGYIKIEMELPGCAI